jgi:hypothetical protein
MKELKISYEEQDVLLSTDSVNKGIILSIWEVDGGGHNKLYLSKQEALDLAKELTDFANKYE